MGLTNVYMWDSQVGYRKVRLEEAIEKYEYGVSAKSGIFFCGWCGEDISLSNPGKYQRHFKHTRAGADTFCKDKVQSQTNSLANHRDNKLILKLEIVAKQPKFYIGFPCVEDSFNKEGSVAIYGIDKHISLGSDLSSHIATYSVSDRFSDDTVTYLAVQGQPYEKYNLEYTGALISESKKGDWPKELLGVSPEGTFFDASQGYRINRNGSVYTDHEYYLVSYGKVTIPSELYPKEIENNAELYRVRNRSKWKIYSLRLPTITEHVSLSVRKFLAQYQLVLRAKPMKAFPIWPACIQCNDVVYHDTQNLYFYLLGYDAEVKKYPKNVVREEVTFLPVAASEKINNENIVRVESLGREQLVTVGLDGVSQFLYLKKRENCVNAVESSLNIKEGSTPWESGIYAILPKDNKLTVTSSVDGLIELWRDGIVRNQKVLKAQDISTISNISWGCTIKVYQGLDCNAELVFERPRPVHSHLSLSDKALCLKLKKCVSSDKYLQNVNSEVKVLLQQYPYTKKWVYKQIELHMLSKKAYRLLALMARGLYKEI